MITRNCPGNRKLCAIAHENGQKTWKGRVLAWPSIPVSVVTVAGNHPGYRKMCIIAHENGGRKHEIHEFWWSQTNHVSVVTINGNRTGNQKLCAIDHENGKKTWKIRVLATTLKWCLCGHDHKNCSGEPKTMRYSPRKWAENMKKPSFGDAPQTL